MKAHRIVAALLLLISMSSVYTLIAGTPRYRLRPVPVVTPKGPAAEGTLRFAAIGDFGMGNQAESDVATKGKSLDVRRSNGHFALVNPLQGQA